jgi:2,4-dienoyl-CoA reductase (NADPH2)
MSVINTPIKVGTMTLKNRVMMVAMHHLYTENGLPTARFNEYYLQRAKGGAGMITVGACRFDDYGAKASTMSLREDKCIAPWREFTNLIHAETDCKVSVQLYHAGRYMRKNEVIADDEAISPSAVYTTFTRETAREMTREDIDRVISDFAEGARRAKEAGFDAVEVSASAGYLLTQFLSPLTNLREDEYGGSFDNRCRFPTEVIDAVRSAVGADFPVIIRLTGNDLVPGARGSADCIEFARRISEKVDMISLTGGWHESRIPQLTGEVPRAGLLHLARAIKSAVNIPVAMANRMGDPRTAQEALELGCCDIIALGRPMVADPEWGGKVTSGRESEVRPCVACNQGCLAGTFFEKPVRCLANGLAGREYMIKGEKPARIKNILVVGGGPAGCEFAIRAAARGHKVTLWEKFDRLGGQLSLAAALPARNEFGSLISWHEREMRRLGVSVSLNTEASAEKILSGGFDEVILANGRGYKSPIIPTGEDAVPVYTAEQYITQKPILGSRVAVIGGSFVGLEVARKLIMDASLSPDGLFYLQRYGIEPQETIDEMLKTSLRHVAVFEKLPKVGAGYEPGIAWPVLGDLSRFGAETHKDTEVLEITREGVITAEGVWQCDAVVIAVGTQEDNSLFDALSGKLPCHKIGNADTLGRAISAIEQAAELGSTI